MSNHCWGRATCLPNPLTLGWQIEKYQLEKEQQRAKVLLWEEVYDKSSRPDSGLSSVLSGGPAVPPGPSSGGPAVPPGPGAGDLPDLPPPNAKAGILVDMQHYILSEYLCDFGNVIKGTQLTKTFKVTNVGFAQISFELSKGVKSLTSGCGVIIEPDRVNRLPGAPDFESVDFAVSFNSGRAGVKLGPMELLIPLTVRSGPQVPSPHRLFPASPPRCLLGPIELLTPLIVPSGL